MPAMHPADFTPPMRHGVSASKVFLKPSPSSIQTVFAYMCLQFPHIEAAEWQQRFTDGLIYDAKGQQLRIDSAFQAGSHVFYYRFLKREIHVPFEHAILFENDDLLVIDKPHFLTISPTGQYVQETLLVRLKNQIGNEQLSPIHRLDRETAGVVLFSKRPETRGIYQQMFADRQVQKTYHAVATYDSGLQFPQTVRLNMDKGQPFYTMQVCEGTPNSETEIQLLEHNQLWAKYLLKPHTGKQHQLRVHLSHLGLPIKNDPFYPKIAHKADDDFTSPLQLLAKHLEFKDPVTLKALQFSSKMELTL